MLAGVACLYRREALQLGGHHVGGFISIYLRM